MIARAVLPAADDGAGFLKKRARRIAALGIRAIGPSAPPSPPAPPTKADRVRDARREDRAEREHRRAVEREIAAVDLHAGWVETQLAARGGAPVFGGGVDYRHQEMTAELRQLAQLRVMLEGDRERGPITADRDGRPVDARLRAYIVGRARQLSEEYWAAAQRADAEGDHRRARVLRRDALRARHIAEHEAGLRPSLPGYTTAWS